MIVSRLGEFSRHAGSGVATGIVRSSCVGGFRAMNTKVPEKPEVDDETVKLAMKEYIDAKGRGVTPAAILQRPDLGISNLPENPQEVLALDPLPPAHQGRKVVIYQKSRAATTSGTGGLTAWNLEFKNRERWSNPLMGWTSTGDPLSNLSMQFDTPEQAVRFCEKRGWKYEVKPPLKREQVLGDFKYADNFLPQHVSHKLKIEKTETRHFDQPTGGASHYERPLNFHGTGIVRQHGNPETQN
ncbi:unnamed protein product [Discosporangium mesarthrocarpum]